MVARDDHAGPCQAARLFDIVWETMADVIGSAATATLVRRSARRAVERCRELDGLSITRDGFRYSYALPVAWREDGPQAVLAVRALVRELEPLLVELTGQVLLRRLAASTELQRCRVLSEEPPP